MSVTNIDDKTRVLLERLCGKEIPLKDWPKVRQCLRCLCSGEVIAPVPGRKVKKITKDPSRGVLTVLEACLKVADVMKDKASVVEAARSLVLV